MDTHRNVNFKCGKRHYISMRDHQWNEFCIASKIVNDTQIEPLKDGDMVKHMSKRLQGKKQ